MKLALLLLLCSLAFGQTKRSVSFSWVASTIPEVTGTNIRRAPGTCSPALPATAFVLVNPTPITGTSYTDNTTFGTWCYYATFVGAPGESNPSNMVTVTITLPAPTGFTATQSIAIVVKDSKGKIIAQGNETINLTVGQ